MSADDHLSPDQFFHGTAARLSPGDMVKPGHAGHDISSGSHVYFAAQEEHARTFGGLAAIRDGKPAYHVYRVEPTGVHERDPDSWGGYRSTSPLRVVGAYEHGSVPGDPDPWYHQPETGKGYPPRG